MLMVRKVLNANIEANLLEIGKDVGSSGGTPNTSSIRLTERMNFIQSRIPGRANFCNKPSWQAEMKASNSRKSAEPSF